LLLLPLLLLPGTPASPAPPPPPPPAPPVNDAVGVATAAAAATGDEHALGPTEAARANVRGITDLTAGPFVEAAAEAACPAYTSGLYGRIVASRGESHDTGACLESEECLA
jgi:hypothetical protein